MGDVNWRDTHIKATKKAIKAKIDQSTNTSNPKDRLQFILDKIREHRDEHSPDGLLTRFIYMMSALVHHERYGGLRDYEVRNIARIAEMILQSEGIKPAKSKLSYLYGELHLILSQIFSQSGEHVAAAWEQQQCYQQAKPEPPGGRLFHALSMGNRLLRLGHATFARRYYNFAGESDPKEKNGQLARLGTIRALRLSGEAQGAEEMIDKMLALADVDERIAAEILWEKLCLQVMRTGDLGPMIFAVRRGGSHVYASYIVEAFLWAKCSSNGEWKKRLPTMRGLSRQTKLAPRNLGETFTIALDLEEASNLDFPLRYRLQKLGDIAVRTKNLLSVDKEALVWGATARILTDARAWALASIAVREYQTICLKLSDGKSSDIFGVVGDLVTRSWFENPEF